MMRRRRRTPPDAPTSTTQGARARDLLRAPAPLRPRRRGAQLRPGSALARGARRRRRRRPGERVLDVATGTGMVAAALARRYGAASSALDQSPQMLAAARARLARLAGARRAGHAASKARPSGSRSPTPIRPPHLHLPAALRRRPRRDARELARVVKPGGAIASLEFGVPAARAAARAVAALHARRPAGARPCFLARVGEAGRFLARASPTSTPATRWPLARDVGRRGDRGSAGARG